MSKTQFGQTLYGLAESGENSTASRVLKKYMTIFTKYNTTLRKKQTVCRSFSFGKNIMLETNVWVHETHKQLFSFH